MSNRYCNIDGSQAIKDNYDDISEGFDTVESEMDAEGVARTAVNTRVTNHVEGTTEKHDDADINNTSEATGSSVKAALNSLKSLIDAMVAGDSNASIGLYQINGSGSDTITGTYTDLTYFTDMMLLVTTDGTNETETPTFNLNSLGAKSIKTMDRSGTKVDLRPGAMPAKAFLVYDGTDLILLNGVGLEYSTEATLYGEISDLLTTSFGGTFKKLELRGQTLVNSVVNGNFADGSNWTPTGGTESVSNNIYELTGDGTSSGIRAQQTGVFEGILNEKWFFYEKSRVTNSNSTYLKLSLYDETTTHVVDQVANPTINTWYELYGIYEVLNADTHRIWLYHYYADAATANGKVMEIDGTAGVFAINLTAMGTDANGVSYEDYTEATLLELVRAGYFEGMSHTMAQCIESVNENLLSADKLFSWLRNIDDATLISDNEISFDNDKYAGYRNTETKFKENTQYTFSLDWRVTGSACYIIVYYTDGTNSSTTLGTGSTTYINSNYTTTAGKTVESYTFSYAVGGYTIFIKNFKIEENDTATDYKKHENSKAFINETVRSTPSVADSLDILRGIKVERNEEYTLESGDITAMYTSAASLDYARITRPSDMTDATDIGVAIFNVREDCSSTLEDADNIGKFSVVFNSGEIWVGFANGTSLGDAQTALTGEKITYAKDPAYYTTKQLPPQPIQSYNKGTLYKTRKTTMVGLFESGFLIEDDTLPIASITKARLIDAQTGKETYVDPSTITVASGGLSVTAITDATNGQYYWLEYIYIANSTPGLLNYEHSQNEFSQVEQNSFGLARLQDRMSSLETKPNIKTVSIYINTTGYGSFSTANIFEPGRDIEVVGAKVFALDITGVTGATTWTVRLTDSGANYIAALTKTANPSGPEELTIDKDYTKIASDGHIGFSLSKNAAVSDGQYNIIIDYIER